MRTVKEISELTGISVRTLHYYDEIGLLKPSDKSGAGYRLYDDKALETLQQILFFREFDIPLKEIKAVMDNPALDRNQILQMQRGMLETKKEHIERLISSIDDILRGENKMDFEVFNREDIEQLYQSIMTNLPEEQRQGFMETYVDSCTGLTAEEKKKFKESRDMEEFRRLFIKNASSEDVQKNFEKAVEWYGDKESAVKAGTNPKNPQIFQAYQNRLEAVIKKIADKRGSDVTKLEIKELIGEYESAASQLYQMKDMKALMLDLTKLYTDNEKAKAALDEQYGDGMAEFFASAVKEYYREK